MHLWSNTEMVHNNSKLSILKEALRGRNMKKSKVIYNFGCPDSATLSRILLNLSIEGIRWYWNDIARKCLVLWTCFHSLSRSELRTSFLWAINFLMHFCVYIIGLWYIWSFKASRILNWDRTGRVFFRGKLGRLINTFWRKVV